MEPIRDFMREQNFKEAYNLEPKIEITYEFNPDGTFKMFQLKFYFEGRSWVLTEHYLGSQNVTDYCTLSGSGSKSIFSRFYDAELKLVEFMKNGHLK